MKNNLLNFFPLYYALHTRSNGLLKKITFILTTFLPSLLLLIFEGNILDGVFFIKYVIVFFIMYSIYEIGFIINDIYTVETEKLPTLRLSSSECLFVKNSILLLISSRFFYTLIGIIFLRCLNEKNIPLFSFFLVILHIIYLLHNYLRSYVNIITYAVLSFIKLYSLLIVSDVPSHNISLVVIFLIFVVPRTWFYITKKFVQNRKCFDNTGLYQGFYFIIFTIVFYLFYKMKCIDLIYLIFSVFFAIYRFSLYQYRKHGNIKKSIAIF
jgi:hypothetical protein